MATNINRVLISGNLTRDCEVRQTQSGTAVTRFSVAVNDRRKNEYGEWADIPNYIDCVLFGKYGEAVSESLVKGAKVFIEGKLRWSQWEKDGKKHSKIEVVADSLELPAKGKAKEPAEQASLYDSDIPF